MHKHLDKIKQWVKMLEAGYPEDKIVQWRTHDQDKWRLLEHIPNWSKYYEYRVALAFVEGKPVFEDDELYDSYGNKHKMCADGVFSLLVEAGKKYHCSTSKKYSWNPPTPKTITLDDLPIPKEYAVGTISPELRIDFHSYEDRSFWYRKIKEAMKND